MAILEASCNDFLIEPLVSAPLLLIMVLFIIDGLDVGFDAPLFTVFTEPVAVSILMKSLPKTWSDTLFFNINTIWVDI